MGTLLAKYKPKQTQEISVFTKLHIKNLKIVAKRCQGFQHIAHRSENKSYFDIKSILMLMLS